MANKEEIKARIPDEVVRAENASKRPMTGTEDLLSAMSNKEAKPEIKETHKIKEPHKTRWLRVFTTCCCLLAIVAAGKGFLYLDAKVSAVVKELDAVKTHIAATDSKEQLAAVTAEMRDLKATHTQLRAEVKEIRDTLEALKPGKSTVVPAQRTRR